LQVTARKFRCAVLALTHLNATGHFLGRRVMEKVRLAMRMSCPEGQPEGRERRRLEVVKSNSKVPAPLGVTMGDRGNDYDANPPEDPQQEAGPTGRSAPRLQECSAWLESRLQQGIQQVKPTLAAAHQHRLHTNL